MHSVPTTREVVPGAPVNIVLKADQPTARTVQGTVAQLLTKGDHPRGIKVRLADGRVGRVQSLAGDSTASGSQSSAGEAMALDAETPGRSIARGARDAWTDYRLQEKPLPTQAVGLDAYIKPAKTRGKANKRHHDSSSALGAPTAETSPQESEESTCPVCGDFRGDVAAITHHVQSHFDD